MCSHNKTIGEIAKEYLKSAPAVEDYIDPNSIPEVEREKISSLCRFLIFGQGYAADKASQLVDYYLNFFESHPEINE